jgi:hypothetical protein
MKYFMAPPLGLTRPAQYLAGRVAKGEESDWVERVLEAGT